MKQKNKRNIIEWVLRITICFTFIGHGLIAIKGNVNWLVYFSTVGFSPQISKTLIVIVGILDIFVALIILLKPNKYIVLWAVFWTFTTALIRPLSGESILAFIERGANWGAPLALYILLYNEKSHTNYSQ